MASGLPLHGLAVYEPLNARELGRDVGCGVYGNIDELSVSSLITHMQRNEGGRDCPDRRYVRGLIYAAAHRRERVVVIAAAPHRSTASEEGEVRRSGVSTNPVASKWVDGDPYECAVLFG